MVWPAILAGLGLGALFTTVRAGARAYARFKLIPPELFDPKRFKKGKFSPDTSEYYYGGFESSMTIQEAKLILGADAFQKLSKDQLHKLHRNAMLMNHPDKGGSAYLAMKINQAKDKIEKEG